LGNVDLSQCTKIALDYFFMMTVHQLPKGWLPVSIAPSDADLEVGVMDKRDVHALVFPVHRSGSDWVML
jgi:hypothetical protein